MALALIIFGLTFYPVIKAEIKYILTKRPSKVSVVLSNQKVGPGYQKIVPIDTNFGIVIPKIEANARVIPFVDPNNERAYQVALTKGVAHAKGSSLPGQAGNVFIFAHSAGNFYDANRYNAIFYLLTKMEKGDKVDLFYKEKKYVYTVTDKKLVSANDVSYIYGNQSQKTLTLMTCWPPGTTWKRLLVIGHLE